MTSGNLVGLRLQSSGTSSFIDNEVGDMYIRQEADGNNIFFQADDGSGGNTIHIFLLDLIMELEHNLKKIQDTMMM